jgi:hypothetical protein
MQAEMSLREAALLEMQSEIKQQSEGRREAEAEGSELRDRLQDAARLQERLQMRLSAHGEEMRAEVRDDRLVIDECRRGKHRTPRASYTQAWFGLTGSSSAGGP